MGNGTGLSSLPLIVNRTDGGQFDDREYGTEVAYSGFDPDFDCRDDKDTVGYRGERRGMRYKYTLHTVLLSPQVFIFVRLESIYSRSLNDICAL